MASCGFNDTTGTRSLQQEEQGQDPTFPYFPLLAFSLGSTSESETSDECLWTTFCWCIRRRQAKEEIECNGNDGRPSVTLTPNELHHCLCVYACARIVVCKQISLYMCGRAMRALAREKQTMSRRIDCRAEKRVHSVSAHQVINLDSRIFCLSMRLPARSCLRLYSRLALSSLF